MKKGKEGKKLTRHINLCFANLEYKNAFHFPIQDGGYGNKRGGFQTVRGVKKKKLPSCSFFTRNKKKRKNEVVASLKILLFIKVFFGKHKRPPRCLCRPTYIPFFIWCGHSGDIEYALSPVNPGDGYRIFFIYLLLSRHKMTQTW